MSDHKQTEEAQGLAAKAWGKFKGRNDIICPNQNCGFQGPAKLRSSFSVIIFIPLLLLGIVPGILYMLFTMGVKMYCPQCRVQIGTK